jgi:hypothetical protein
VDAKLILGFQGRPWRNLGYDGDSSKNKRDKKHDLCTDQLIMIFILSRTFYSPVAPGPGWPIPTFLVIADPLA